jgi:hypothetical protein
MKDERCRASPEEYVRSFEGWLCERTTVKINMRI